MSILKRIVPEPIVIKDYREGGGIHYEAKCDQCSRIYYPKRSTSKFCSRICIIESNKKVKVIENKVDK
jgi:uncharacterized OB-fold protein